MFLIVTFMIPENVGYMFYSVVTGVVAGLVLRLAQIISKKVNKEEYWWVEMLIAIGILVGLAYYLTHTFR